MARTALVYDPNAFSGPPAGTKEATRDLIRRVLAAIEVELGEPTAWRLFQLTVAMAEYRFGRYDAAAALARHAMLPLDQIPPIEAAGLSGFPLGVVRHQVHAL
jgi:hypothetical protein